jgi:hypothetical protein
MLLKSIDQNSALLKFDLGDPEDFILFTADLVTGEVQSSVLTPAMVDWLSTKIKVIIAVDPEMMVEYPMFLKSMFNLGDADMAPPLVSITEDENHLATISVMDYELPSTLIITLPHSVGSYASLDNIRIAPRY